jgi:hypothetical protein
VSCFWNDTNTISSVPTGGGALELIARNDCGPLYGFAVDSSRVYYGRCISEYDTYFGVAAYERLSGDTVVLNETAKALDVAVVAGELVAVACEGTFSVLPISGGGAIELPFHSADAETPSFGCPAWIEPVGSRAITGSRGALMLLDPSTGVYEHVADGRVLATEDEHIYYDASPGLAVLSVRGEVVDVFEATPGHAIVAAAVHDGQLYYAEDDKVFLVEGARAAVVLEGLADVQCLAVDDEAIYWVAGGALMKLVHRGVSLL